MKQPRNPVIIRKRVVKKVLDGEKVTAVAKRFRVSRKFVYKWLKRYREDPSGEWWKERSRRPKNIQKKVTEEVRTRIIELRKEYGLNMMKIEQWFRRKGLKISHTMIWKVLEQEGEKSWRKKNKKVKARKRFEREKPNELCVADRHQRTNVVRRTRTAPLSADYNR